MDKLTPENLNPEIYNLFDKYVHSQIDRRQFLRSVGKYTAAGISANSVLAFLSPNYAEAVQIAANDERLKTEYIEYDSAKGGGSIKALLSRKAEVKDKLPGIVVVHENRGLNPHIEDVARRGAIDGFITIAPDALTPLGGYPGNDDDGRALQKKRDRNEMLEDFIAAYDYLYNHPECNGCIGVVGFCFGGSIANKMAVRIPGLKAAVPFYGGQPSADEVALIHAPLLLHYAEQDKRVNAGWPAYEEALKKHKKEYIVHVYPDVKHGFHNDTTPRFDKPSASLAWQRSIDFFRQKLVK
ncbi:MAG: dienelactone hydrolase family protein [Alcanivoracaceae bacterium]|nr:dienelactone hydrolase family protein [Alcanivoracaceae bacterium]